MELVVLLIQPESRCRKSEFSKCLVSFVMCLHSWGLDWQSVNNDVLVLFGQGGSNGDGGGDDVSNGSGSERRIDPSWSVLVVPWETH
jgi:hypothetical protein